MRAVSVSHLGNSGSGFPKVGGRSSLDSRGAEDASPVSGSPPLARRPRAEAETNPARQTDGRKYKHHEKSGVSTTDKGGQEGKHKYCNNERKSSDGFDDFMFDQTKRKI